MTARLQRWLDTAAMASRQRWALGSVAVAAILVALTATLAGTDDRFGWFSMTTVVLAAVAAVQPGSHAAAVVLAAAVLQWVPAAGDLSTPRSLLVALCLITFHSVVALMEVTPHSATVHREVLRRWALRGGVVAVATTLVWLLARVLERRGSAANPNLTLLAVLAAAAGVVTLLVRATDDGDR